MKRYLWWLRNWKIKIFSNSLKNCRNRLGFPKYKCTEHFPMKISSDFKRYRKFSLSSFSDRNPKKQTTFQTKYRSDPIAWLQRYRFRKNRSDSTTPQKIESRKKRRKINTFRIYKKKKKICFCIHSFGNDNNTIQNALGVIGSGTNNSRESIFSYTTNDYCDNVTSLNANYIYIY